jgi:hypothetical protein
MYDPNGDQQYCTVCNPVLVNLNTVKIKKGSNVALISQTITKPYRDEIRKALSYSRSLMRGPEGKKNFRDLESIVDIEIWKASQRYADKMNEALAFTIAKNQANKFLAFLAEQPETVSLDDKKLDDNGEPQEATDAEKTISARRDPHSTESSLSRNTSSDLDVILGDRLEAIGGVTALKLQLVRAWFGAKRRVGEYLLKHPDSAVRDIPGVPKSTAARLRPIILAEFRNAILGTQGQATQQDIGSGGTN